MSPIHVLTSCLRALLDWAPAFALTQLIEVPIYRRTLRCPAEVAFAASAITHPIVWFLFPWMGCHMLGVRGVPVVVASELFAWIAEAVYLAFARVGEGRRSCSLLSRTPPASAWACSRKPRPAFEKRRPDDARSGTAPPDTRVPVRTACRSTRIGPGRTTA